MSQKYLNLSEEEQSSLDSLLFCVLRLDIWLYKVVNQALESGDTRFFGIGDRSVIADQMEIYKHFVWSNTTFLQSYNGYVTQDIALREDIRKYWGYTLAVFAVETTKLPPYMEHLIDQGIDVYQSTQVRYQRLEERGMDGYVLPNEFTVSHGKDTLQYPTWCRSKFHDAHKALLQIHKVALELRSAISKMPMSLDANPRTIPFKPALRLRMSALNDSFPNLCRELGKPVQRLIGDDPDWWNVEPRIDNQPSAGPVPSSGPSSGNQWHLPSNATATDVNGPQLLSSVFNAPVYFGNARPPNPIARASSNEQPQNRSEAQAPAHSDNPISQSSSGERESSIDGSQSHTGAQATAPLLNQVSQPGECDSNVRRAEAVEPYPIDCNSVTIAGDSIFESYGESEVIVSPHKTEISLACAFDMLENRYVRIVVSFSDIDLVSLRHASTVSGQVIILRMRKERWFSGTHTYEKVLLYAKYIEQVKSFVCSLARAESFLGGTIKNQDKVLGDKFFTPLVHTCGLKALGKYGYVKDTL